MIRTLLLSAFLSTLCFCAFAQETWTLVKDQDGIKVYTRRIASEKFKEVRATFELNATEDQLIRVIQNIPHQKDWSYGTKRTFLISKISKDTLIYYSEISLPWPLSNRDLVIQLSINRDTLNNSLHIRAKSIPGILPAKPDLVRVPMSIASWDVKIMPNNLLNIQYTLSTDPGGTLPAWLVNFAASVGPYNSFQKLKALISNENKHQLLTDK